MDILTDPDSLRELVHEIKTPLNAIIGFAEIIEGQYLGPADHRYRARAAEIVTQARVLLGAIDDLDFAAKIHSSAAPADRRTDLTQLLAQVGDPLREAASAREVEIDIEMPDSGGVASIEPELAERLLNRLGNSAIERAEPRERIRVSANQSAGICRVSVGRPAALRNLSDAQLFDAASVGAAMDAPVLPVAFTLRVVRGLASIAGGEFVATPTEFVITFPRA